MNIDTTKESVCINQLIEQKTENRVVEEDVIVPDIKPDVFSIIHTSGNICIYKKEVLEGKIKVDGTLQVYAIYSADNENNSIRSLCTNLDFSETIQIQNTAENVNLILKTKLLSIETKILNGRKINIKGNLSFGIKLYSDDETNIIKEIHGIDNMQELSHEIEVNSLIGKGQTKAFAKESIVINQADNLAEVLNTDVSIKNRDIKVSYNKVLAKADTCVKITYLTDDNRICSYENTIPTMGFIDIKDVSDNNICETFFEIKNILIKPGGEDEHSIYVEIEFEIACFAFEKKKITIIEDLYSPAYNVNYIPKSIDIIEHKANNSANCILNENIPVHELQGCKICNVNVKPIVTAQKILDNHIKFKGDVKLTLLYLTENENVLKTKELTIPLEFIANISEIDDKAQIDTELEVQQCETIINEDNSMNIKIEIKFLITSCNIRNIIVIDEIDIDENIKNSNYSIIIYYTKRGDTLWNIAKIYGSTIEEIAKINEIENIDILQAGMQLYIPRYNSKKLA